MSHSNLALEQGNDMIRFVFQEKKGMGVEMGWNGRNGGG